MGRHGDGWRLRVAAAPEQGRANEALVRLLAGALDVPRSSVSVVGGQTARRKIVEVDGLDKSEIERRLGRCILDALSRSPRTDPPCHGRPGPLRSAVC